MEVSMISTNISQEIPAGTRRAPQEVVEEPGFLPAFLGMVLGQTLADTAEVGMTGVAKESGQTVSTQLAIGSHMAEASLHGGDLEAQVSVGNIGAHEPVMAEIGPAGTEGLRGGQGAGVAKTRWDMLGMSQGAPLRYPVRMEPTHDQWCGLPLEEAAPHVEGVVTGKRGLTVEQGAVQAEIPKPGVLPSLSGPTGRFPTVPSALGVAGEPLQHELAEVEPGDGPHPANMIGRALENEFPVRLDLTPPAARVPRGPVMPDLGAGEAGDAVTSGPSGPDTEAPVQSAEAPAPYEGKPRTELGDLAREMVERVKMIRSGERHLIEVDLKPEHLGRLTIRVTRDPDGVAARFEVQSHATKVLVEQNLGNLRQILEGQGIKLGGLGVDIGQDRGRPKQDSGETIAIRHQEPQTHSSRGSPSRVTGRIDYLA